MNKQVQRHSVSPPPPRPDPFLLGQHAPALRLLDRACTQAGPTSSLERRVAQHNTHTGLINESSAALTNFPHPCGLMHWASLWCGPQHWCMKWGHESPQIVNRDIHICLARLKRVGTPFSGPPFLQSGIPRPQRALFPGHKDSFINGNTRSWAAILVQVIPLHLGVILFLIKFSSELVDLNLVMITAWLEIQGPAAKLKGAHRFLQGAQWFVLFPLP